MLSKIPTTSTKRGARDKGVRPHGRAHDGLRKRTIEQVGPVCEEGVPHALNGLGLGDVRSGRSFGCRGCRGCLLKRGGPRAQTPIDGEGVSHAKSWNDGSTVAHQIALPLFESRESLIGALRRSTTCRRGKVVGTTSVNPTIRKLAARTRCRAVLYTKTKTAKTNQAFANAC